ncbi:hypothetical protein PRIPAC_94220, partial [Pristionchus pacificus]|uniref:Uncharacterized protein n=1 Tax=Pristionchus pacificus TaxID=54126 RepID=A0A2A6CDF8_PRIPA
DPHLAQPNPINSRGALQIAALVFSILLLPVSGVGSYCGRQYFPSTTSPMPLIACILLLLTLYLLDNLRNNIARIWYTILMVKFSILSLAILTSRLI